MWACLWVWGFCTVDQVSSWDKWLRCLCYTPVKNLDQCIKTIVEKFRCNMNLPPCPKQLGWFDENYCKALCNGSERVVKGGCVSCHTVPRAAPAISLWRWGCVRNDKGKFGNFTLGFLFHKKKKKKFCLCSVLGRSNYSGFMQYLSPHRVTQGIRHLPFDLVFIEHT